MPISRIHGTADMLADPQFVAREALVEVDSPRWGMFKMQNAVLKLFVTPSAIRRLAPASVGEHNDRDLLRIDAGERERLHTAGAI